MNNADLAALNEAYPMCNPNGKPVYIYALLDPETGVPRYIGKSIRPVERFTNHMNERSKCHRSHWLQSLKARGMKPEMVILERIEGAWPWQEAECYWIAYGRHLGWPLVNGTSGGDGVVNVSPEAKARMLATWKGRKHTEESKRRIGAASRGRRHSEAWRQDMRTRMAGRKITWVDAIREANSKFTREQEETVRQRLAAGEKVCDLATEFGVHRTTISKIKKGTYRHE